MKSRIHTVALLATGAILGVAASSLIQNARAQTQTPPLPALPGNAGNAKKPVESQVINVDKLVARSSGVGTRRDLFDGPSRTLVNLEGHISTLNPGNVSHEPHQHVNEEVILLTKGKLEVGINNKISTANPGDLMIFASNDWHNVKSVGTEPAEYVVLNWSSTPKPGFTPPTIATPTVFPKASPTGNTGASR